MRISDYHPTFRFKILLALVGTIVPLLFITLLVVRREADRQVNAIVESTANRAGDAFAEIERIRQQQLRQLGARFANSNRSLAALQQALEGDTAFVVEQTRYDLELAGFARGLAAFVSLGGEPLAALLNGHALSPPAAAVPQSAIDSLFAGDTAVFSYHQVGQQLFSVHPTFLVGDQPVGVLLLGLAIDNETARSLANALRADVCFVARGQCVASSTGVAMHELETLAQSNNGRVERMTVDGAEFAKVSRPLPGAAATGTQIVLRIPLADVIRPFGKILRAIRLIGLAVLVLAIVIAVILSRGLTKPVRALVGATARVARGDYKTRVPVHSHDEIGTLAKAFNEMTHGLQLKEKYRGVLDKVVSRDVADEMLKGDIQLGGETREVTMLFADIRGFTSMSEGMAPHDVVERLNEVMELAEAAIVAEGGVVDKYVGDEIMALFGAPVAGQDDALRAIRAALRMQREIAALNERRPPGRAAISFGIGINTGDVVAGNMGSARRLNYTVIGAPVNLAARLCSEARAGQILVAQPTVERAGKQVRVASLGARDIKGLSRPVEIFEVLSVAEDASRPAHAGAALAIVFALLCAASTPALAQRTITLGPLQLQPSARIDLQGFIPGDQPAWLIRDTTAFVAGRVSGFLDIFAGRHIYGLAEVRVDRGEIPGTEDLAIRIEQAFLRFTPFVSADAALQVGRFVSPFGNYTQRHHSAADPLIRPPLSYDLPTVIGAGRLPPNVTEFLNWKDRPETFRPIGGPPVWAIPYQLGAMLLGSVGKASYRLALMNSAPSSPPAAWNRWPDGFAEWSFVAHAALQLTPELRLGISYDDGPFLDPIVESTLAAGKTIADYDQRLIGAEVTVTRGFVELRGELLHDAWQVPRVGDEPVDVSYYVESKLKLRPGLFVAGRYSAIHFNELALPAGGSASWDYDARRIQLGAGYRISRALELRGELMLNHTSGLRDPSDNLWSVQASWTID